MQSQDYKAANEDKARVKPSIKSSPQVSHPTLHLQQIVGNIAITSMIQLHEVSHLKLEPDLKDMMVDTSAVRHACGPEQKQPGFVGRIGLREQVIQNHLRNLRQVRYTQSKTAGDPTMCRKN